MGQDKIEINAAGKKGKPGHKGHVGERGRDGYYYSGNGDTGGIGKPGGRGDEGTNGDNVWLDLSVDETGQAVVLKSQGQMDKRLNLGACISIDARGGMGGRGGRGGRGGKGGNGADGLDANRFRNATNGGNGGQGGQGGRGGDGGPGGDGGNITFTLKDKDSDLLMLCDWTLEGGKGGVRGHKGEGGDGGWAGLGGNSYGYWDKDHVYQYKQGGYSGSRGDVGRIGDKGRDGRDGREGRLEIKISNGNGDVSTYTKPYDIAISRIELTSPQNHFPIEPGMTFEIKPTFINKGGMPSPAYQKLRFDVLANQHVAQSQELLIEKSLQVGESYTSKEPLIVSIAPDYPVGENPLKEDTRLQFSLSMTRVNKSFHNLGVDEQAVSIQYPLKMATYQELAFTEGLMPNFDYAIENIGNYGIGSQQGRRAWAKIKPKVGAQVDNASKVFDIKKIEAGQDVHFKGQIELDASSYELYDTIAYEAELYLQELDNEKNQCIQRVEFELQKAEAYKGSESEVVLIVNGDNTKEEISFWKQISDGLNLSHDVWNMSLYHDFDIYQYLAERAKSLRPDTLFVFLNNHFDDNRNTEVTSTQFADKEKLFTAMREQGLKVYVVGEKFEMEKTLQHHFDTEETIKKEQVKQRVAAGDAKSFKVPVSKWKFKCQTPSEEELIQKREAIQDELSKTYPWMRFTYATQFKPTETKERLIFRRHRIGDVLISPSLPLNEPWMSHLSFNTDDAVSRQKYLNEQMPLHRFQLLILMPFSKKIDLLKSLQADDKETQNIKNLVYLAIQSQLIQEQSLFRKHSWRGDFSRNTLKNHLPNLKILCQYQPENKEDKEAIENILLTIKYYGKKHTHFYDHLLFNRRHCDLDHVIDELIKDWNKVAQLNDETIESSKLKIKNIMDNNSKKALYALFVEPYALEKRQESGVELIHDTVKFGY